MDCSDRTASWGAIIPTTRVVFEIARGLMPSAHERTSSENHRDPWGGRVKGGRGLYFLKWALLSPYYGHYSRRV